MTLTPSHRWRWPVIVLLAALTVAGLTASPAKARAESRGTLLSALHVRSMSPANVKAELAGAKYDAGLTRFGVDLVRLTYRTIDPAGNPTIATGLLALPKDGNRTLRTVVYTHGTQVYRADAPSVTQDGWELGPPLTYATVGFAAVAPDYLGLGAGPGTHPWQDVRSETTASIDLLRAARSYVAGRGRQLSHDVYVTGFSQGAAAAIGVATALGRDGDGWFRVGAAAPVSGAYHWRNIELPALLGGKLDPTWSVAYVAYFVVTWNRLHPFYSHPGEVFRDPAVAALFDGLRPGKDILPALPRTIETLLTPHGLDVLQRPTGALAAAMAAHDNLCAEWKPTAPTRLYYAAGDEQVLTTNTSECLDAVRTAGSTRVTSVDLGKVSHLDSNVKATAAIARWFRQLAPA
ncbi:lipase [Cryptosporangium minutisporangium]|uniref:Alpha/beta fold hydrolase n=1 Tax=Cryptosporangium minutisporangium TaxID=113569 RepID=A0ABP6STR5_9ACTN